MSENGHERELKPVPGIIFGLVGACALVLGVAVFSPQRPADALPIYAQQTGLACGRCHVNPAGGGPRNAFGKAFAANGHKLPKAASSAKSSNKPSKGKMAGGAAAPAAVPMAPVAATPSVVFDHATAHAISLRPPYFSLFLYDSCDYSDCTTGQ
jgi:hypothetical protein